MSGDDENDPTPEDEVEEATEHEREPWADSLSWL